MQLLARRNFKVAVMQYRIDPDDVANNFSVALQLAQQAADQGAKIIVLPACYATGINFPSIKRMAQSREGRIPSYLADLARKTNTLVVGGFLERADDTVYDTAAAFNPNGEPLAFYRRRSVWSGELDFISPGSDNPVIESRFGKIGLLVGYDIYFPESCRSYFREGVEHIICIGNLFKNYGHNLHALVRARAAENSCSLIYCNALGENRLANLPYNGKSMIVDGTLMDDNESENADILARADRKETVLIGTIPIGHQRKSSSIQPYRSDYMDYWAPVNNQPRSAV